MAGYKQKYSSVQLWKCYIKLQFVRFAEKIKIDDLTSSVSLLSFKNQTNKQSILSNQTVQEETQPNDHC